MNIYTQRFTSKCAANDRTVHYTLVIESQETIMVEEIQRAVAGMPLGYHEKFADDLFARFGGRQTMTAHHHGTDITTVRP